MADKFDIQDIVTKWNDATAFKASVNLYDTVRTNEDFFIGKQWEGVEAEGLPKPVFNILKRVVLFLIASIRSDSVSVKASPMDAVGGIPEQTARLMSDVVSDTISDIFERTKLISLLTMFLRNAAVRGDGAQFVWWDKDAKVGQREPGDIAIENLLNTRVHFGNPAGIDVQKQPWIIIESRELVDDVKRRAEENGEDPDAIEADRQTKDVPDQMTRADANRCTVLLTLRRDTDTGRIMACESSNEAWVRREWDTGLTLYPLVWMPWDEINECQHGQAIVTGLIPNQIFINKLFAMSMISLMSTAYPKIVYNGQMLDCWDNRVGEAIRVDGAPEDMDRVARVIEGRGLSGQVHEYIDAAIKYTRDLMGAPDASLGETAPKNTSAIIAVQRAASVPLELVKRNMYACLEDLARILIDFMGAYYGVRAVKARTPNEELGIRNEEFGTGTPGMAGMPGEALTTPAQAPPLPGGELDGSKISVPFDYSTLRDVAFSLKIDAGAASYWSEISAVTTLDNLFAAGKLELVDYLERLPNGMIPRKQELIDTIRQKMAQAQMMQMMQGGAPGGAGPGPGGKGPGGPPMAGGGPGPPGQTPGPAEGPPREAPGQMRQPMAYLNNLVTG